MYFIKLENGKAASRDSNDDDFGWNGKFDNIEDAVGTALGDAERYNENCEAKGLELFYNMDELEDMRDIELIEKVWAGDSNMQILFVHTAKELISAIRQHEISVKQDDFGL